MRAHKTSKTEENKRVISLARGRCLNLDRPLVMGILNATPDSFSDGGQFLKPDEALAQANQMIAEEADIIDLGGESSRPGAEPVSSEEEQARVIPAIEAIRAESDVCLSIDTYRASTARAAINAGADIINDISALGDPEMLPLAVDTQTPVVLMHMKGSPRDMQTNPRYDDCLTEICGFFEERILQAETVGLNRDQIIIDPGIGFGKRLEDNLRLLANLDRFCQLGCPLLVGTSRKSFIAAVHSVATVPEQRLGGSLASALAAVARGADIIRVHDVAPTVEALKIWQAIADAD